MDGMAAAFAFIFVTILLLALAYCVAAIRRLARLRRAADRERRELEWLCVERSGMARGLSRHLEPYGFENLRFALVRHGERLEDAGTPFGERARLAKFLDGDVIHGIGVLFNVGSPLAVVLRDAMGEVRDALHAQIEIYNNAVEAYNKRLAMPRRKWAGTLAGLGPMEPFVPSGMPDKIIWC